MGSEMCIRDSNDGEYSTIAPFTQICFIPRTTSYSVTNTQKIFKTGAVYYQDDNGDGDGMVNNVTGVNLNIILPSHTPNKDFEISTVEILYKESDNSLVRSVEEIIIEDSSITDGVLQYLYKSTLPYKTLPKGQLVRVYDNVPLAALAQEVVGNRIVYGNFIQDRALPAKKNKVAGLDFSVGLSAKYDITNDVGNADFNNYYLHKEYPFHSVKQRRTYEVGVVLSDKFGRQSPVLTSNTSSSSVEVRAKSASFHSSSWSSTENFIHDASPGNKDYCGDALTITFNSEIPNPYSKRTLIPINQAGTSTYQFQLFKANFGTEVLLTDGSPGNTGGVMINNLYFYDEFSSAQGVIGDYFYTSSTLSESSIVTGYSALYLNTGATDLYTNSYAINKFNLNSETGEILSHEYVSQSFLFIDNVVHINQPILIANQGEEFYLAGVQVVTPEQTIFNHPQLGEVFKLTITNFTQPDLFSVGDYLKGQTKDFVKILEVTTENGIFIIFCDDKPSLEYLNSGVDNYNFNKYKIVPHGWYSYRVVVKQVEQEYHNVYVPSVITIDKDDEGHKSYIPIVADNINKITRDIEFSNIQETGLSTSKAQIYPKILPLTSATTIAGLTANLSRSIQSDKDLIDVISIGTAREQDLKDEENNVLAFIYETNKNPLVAQIPYGNSSLNIGQDITSDFEGIEYTFTGVGDGQNASEGLSGNTKLNLPGTDIAVFTGGTNVVTIGDYLSGKNTNLVKIESISGDGTQTLISCDGEISDIYFDAEGTTGNKIYKNKYGLQNRISVFETKPFESALDIYYETSTAGYIHELNEAVTIITDISEEDVTFIDTQDFSEDTVFYDEFGNFQNVFAGTLNILDENGNNLTLGSELGQVNSGGVEIIQQDAVGPNETSSLSSNFAQAIGVTSSSDFRFIIFEDENTSTFKLKPKPGLGNFAYSPTLEPTKYIFKIRITVNGDGNNVPDEIFIIDNVEINLQNVAPVVLSSGNIEAQQNNDDILGTPIHQIIATNGSANQENNSSGLRFRCKDLQSQFITTTNGLEGSEAIFDLDGDLIEELRIDTSTGEIFLTDAFNEESLNVSFAIRITDGSDFLSDEDFQSGIDEHGGIFVDHQIDLIVSDGLIVLSAPSSHSVPSAAPEDLPGGINIFQNEGATDILTSDSMETDNQSRGVSYGSYWTTTPNGLQQTNLINNENILNSAPEGSGLAYGPIGIFLCSETGRIGTYAPGGNNTLGTKIWALRVINNIPVVVVYYKEVGIGNTGMVTRQWFNHHLYDGWGYIRCSAGTVQIKGTGSSSLPYTSSFGDIDGTLSPNPSCPAHPEHENVSQLYGNTSTYEHVNMELLNDSGWRFNEPGTHPIYGSANSNEYEGSFPYYNNENEIVNTISKPEDSLNYYQGSPAPPFYHSGGFLGKCNDNVVINSVEYKILYTYTTGGNYIGNSSGFNETRLSVQKVFLCRKQQ